MFRFLQTMHTLAFSSVQQQHPMDMTQAHRIGEILSLVQPVRKTIVRGDYVVYHYDLPDSGFTGKANGSNYQTEEARAKGVNRLRKLGQVLEADEMAKSPLFTDEQAAQKCWEDGMFCFKTRKSKTSLQYWGHYVSLSPTMQTKKYDDALNKILLQNSTLRTKDRSRDRYLNVVLPLRQFVPTSTSVPAAPVVSPGPAEPTSVPAAVRLTTPSDPPRCWCVHATSGCPTLQCMRRRSRASRASIYTRPVRQRRKRQRYVEDDMSGAFLGGSQAKLRLLNRQ